MRTKGISYLSIDGIVIKTPQEFKTQAGNKRKVFTILHNYNDLHEQEYIVQLFDEAADKDVRKGDCIFICNGKFYTRIKNNNLELIVRTATLADIRIDANFDQGIMSADNL